MRNLSAIVAVCAIFGVEPVSAQFGRGGSDWVTSGADAHRSSWVRTDPKISKAGMEKGGFEFLWKIKINSNAPSTMMLMDRYIGYRGFRSMGYVGGSSDQVVAFDTDLGRIEWQKRIAPSTMASNSPNCPGGMTSNLARTSTTAFPVSGGIQGGGGGRGGPAKSGVGEPNEGAVTLSVVLPNQPPQAGPPRPRPAGGGPPRRLPNYVYAISSDGLFHSMYVSNGEEPKPAVPFLPAKTNANGLIVIDEFAYVATSEGCGGASDGVWALDIASGKVANWQSTSGSVVGSMGPSFGPDGTVYAATSKGDLVALEPKTLGVKSTYSSGQELTSSPLIFQHKNKTMIAVLSKDGSIHILDAESLANAVSKTPVKAAGAISSWQDASGTRWFLTNTTSGISAWKLGEDGSLVSGWTSREMISPLTPTILNGVVFAVAGGNPTTPAVLYALDSATGKEMWSSGKTITSYVKDIGISGSGSQVYLSSYDGNVYAFGYPLEH